MNIPRDLARLESKLGFSLHIILQIGDLLQPDSKRGVVADNNGNILGLNLFGCQLKSLSFLTQLPHITYLNLGSNNFNDLSPLAKAVHLELLYLGNNGISDLSCLSGLTSLRHLDLRDNKIRDISPLYPLIRLVDLDLAFNRIADIKPLENLRELSNIDLRENKISSLAPLLYLLKKGIPVNMAGWEFRAINLMWNPIDKTLLDIIAKGSDALIRHFERIAEEGMDYIHEAKLTFVGDGSSGKTSLQVRLLDEKADLPTTETRTRGIEIHDWYFDGGANKKYIAHIWDFGGQDVYYPVHRFFLTENSIFVLVASTRHENHNFAYWIPTIFQFGNKSPIIIVQNCFDGNKKAWNDIGLYISNSDFNIIKTQQLPYYEINLPNNNEGLAEIKGTIINQIRKLVHFGKGVPRSWVPIRDAIAKESEGNACISFDRFIQICRATNSQRELSITDIKDIAYFFHSLGIILWYAENNELVDWVILQPEWAMNAVYRILDDDEVLKRRGVILSADFNRLWSTEFYLHKHSILKKMLQVFKIAFPKRHIPSDYILPARLLSIPDGARWSQDQQCLRLEYHYQFMPKGLVNQLSSELSRLIVADDDVWNNAVNFMDEDKMSQAQVVEDFYGRKLYIKAKGRDARGLIKIIMNTLKDITSEYKGITPDIRVPCICAFCEKNPTPYFFSYGKLLEYLGNKRDYVTCNDSDTRLPIDKLLFMAGLSDTDRTVPRPSKMLRAFISYSRLDAEESTDGINYLEDLKKHLKPLSEFNSLLATWDDTLLIPGEEWDDRIRDELQKSDVIFLLISHNFLNTKYVIDTELKIAIHRYEKQKCVIIPIVIRSCGWLDIPLLSRFSGIPKKGFSIASWERNPKWKKIDDAWLHVYNEVKNLILEYIPT